MGKYAHDLYYDEDRYWDWHYQQWHLAFEKATDQVMPILPSADRAQVREAIEQAHTEDDPDWSFNTDRLIDHLATLARMDRVSDHQYEALVTLFPVRPGQ